MSATTVPMYVVRTYAGTTSAKTTRPVVVFGPAQRQDCDVYRRERRYYPGTTTVIPGGDRLWVEPMSLPAA